ncbi:MAG: multicopper oxidase domain-containing protein, partial [Mycobacterium sp.]|nr:multicopper oxidase domain-containing protein [Mycobacterium sp.]
GGSLNVGMFEFQQRILPDSVYAGLQAPFNAGSFVWGYSVQSANEFAATPASAAADATDANVRNGSRPSYPGRTVEVTRGGPAPVRYSNNLPNDPVLRKFLTIDQTIHWADPLHQGHLTTPYTGPIPTVVHLHGAEDQSTSDGAPEAWFTNNGLHGPGYFSQSPTASNAAVYLYPNGQESTTLWFHDHSLGITRINVFSGLAAMYFIRDQFDTGQPNNPLGLPAGAQEIELMIQDRGFDTNGQLLFPDSAANPSAVDGPPSNPKIHPFWIPEFFGDTMVVNGRTWPFLDVEPRRYRFRIVNASNARFVRMGLVDQASGAVGPAMFQIGTDGGLLDTPVKLAGQPEPVNSGVPAPSSRLFLAPSERADIIIDFAGQQGKNFIVTNDGQVPFPSGDPLDQNDPTRQVMLFRVNQQLSSQDHTYDPSTGRPLRGAGSQEPPAIVRFVNPNQGTLVPQVQPQVKRQLVLFEFEDVSGNGGNTAGTPVEDLVNNTKWSGRRDGGNSAPLPGSVQDQQNQDIWMTETPRVGSTEVWEFLNLTVDAHPIHVHLVQFQLLNRQPVALDANGDPTYIGAWAAQFPGGTFNGETGDGTWGPINYPKGTIIPGYGPPGDYNTPNADGALGGNPAFGPFLSGPTIPPDPTEAGWKDVAKVYPHYVTR